MKNFTTFGNKLSKLNPLWTYIIYFSSLSLLGFAILTSLNPRTSINPNKLDLFFTSVSAATVSSMSTVDMEVFSNTQLIVMTILMFLGGEVFISMVGLHLNRSKIITRSWNSIRKEKIHESIEGNHHLVCDQIELTTITILETGLNRPESLQKLSNSHNPILLKYDSVKFLGSVVLGYLLIIHILGIASVLIYLSFIPSAEDVLRKKGLKTFTFAVFTIVSTFANCGFVPTNENMVVFGKNSGLLLILIPQILFGNTLFPSCLRFVIWVFGKIRIKKAEADFLLKNTSAVGYTHLLSGEYCKLLVATVVGFVSIGFFLFCSMEWDSAGLSGLNAYQKAVGAIFQCVNARHAGETIVDLSAIAPAVLVFFVVMMYLPPYTSFVPINTKDEQKPIEYKGWNTERRKIVAENVVFSQLSYLVMFIILICITERKSLKDDPLNFSVLNITVEVISAYGNVGFTTGYSCERRLNSDPNCVTKWYGFSGKWSDEGKIILIIVMLFGTLKKFNMKGGRAWKLL